MSVEKIAQIVEKSRPIIKVLVIFINKPIKHAIESVVVYKRKARINRVRMAT